MLFPIGGEYEDGSSFGNQGTKPSEAERKIKEDPFGLKGIFDFLGNVFRNMPVTPGVPQAPKADDKPANVTPKPSTPKIGSSSVPKSTTPVVDYTKPKYSNGTGGIGTRSTFKPGGRV
jgi:hypothetical protein